MKKKGKLQVGTSGWHYNHWKGTFYPAGLKAKDQFAYYAGLFDTVEINNSFYRLPKEAMFKAWETQAPKGFHYTVKAPRFFTHMKKLIVVRPDLQQFVELTYNLESKLGVILFQLPPKWKLNPERLELFLAALPEGPRYAFEFREHSWYTAEIYSILQRYNCAFCIYELEHHQSPLEVTADFVYIRLHGPGNKYQGSYTDEQLKLWKKRITTWRNSGKDVYIYFDNDQEGYAAFNALTLKKYFKS